MTPNTPNPEQNPAREQELRKSENRGLFISAMIAGVIVAPNFTEHLPIAESIAIDLGAAGAVYWGGRLLLNKLITRRFGSQKED